MHDLVKGDEAATSGFNVAVGKKYTDKRMNHMKNLEQKSSHVKISHGLCSLKNMSFGIIYDVHGNSET